MKKGQVFKSDKTFKSKDLLDNNQEDGIQLTIKGVIEEVFGEDGVKTCVTFNEDPRKLVVGSLTWDQLVLVTGQEDSDHWPGHKVVVYPQLLDKPFNGNTHGMRVRKPKGEPSRPPSGETHPAFVAPKHTKLSAYTVWKQKFDGAKVPEKLADAWLQAVVDQEQLGGVARAMFGVDDWNAIAAACPADPTVDASSIPFS